MNLEKSLKLNYELFDANRNLLSYLISIYEKNGIPHESIEKSRMLLNQVSHILDKLNPPTGNTNQNHLRGNSTIKRHSYKVLVPYYTVW